MIRIITLSLLLAVSFAYADVPSDNESVIFDEVLELDFEPTSAVLLIRFNNGSLTYTSLEIEPVPQEDAGIWLLSARVSVPTAVSKISFASLVLGPLNQFRFVPFEERAVDSPEFFAGSIELLGSYVEQRAEFFESLKIQEKLQGENLRRLRSDAEVVGNLGRIIEVNNEIEEVDLALLSMDKNIENLNSMIDKIRTFPKPRGYTGRKNELNRQISELAAVAKRAEGSEETRKMLVEAELRRRLDVIEITRRDDIGSLQRELLRLRSRRRELERKAGAPSSEANFDEYQPG